MEAVSNLTTPETDDITRIIPGELERENILTRGLVRESIKQHIDELNEVLDSLNLTEGTLEGEKIFKAIKKAWDEEPFKNCPKIVEARHQLSTIIQADVPQPLNLEIFKALGHSRLYVLSSSTNNSLGFFVKSTILQGYLERGADLNKVIKIFNRLFFEQAEVFEDDIICPLYTRESQYGSVKEMHDNKDTGNERRVSNRRNSI